MIGGVNGGLDGDVAVNSKPGDAVGEAFGKGYLEAVARVEGGDVSAAELCAGLDGSTATALRRQMNSLLTGSSKKDAPKDASRAVSITDPLPGWDDHDDTDFFPDTTKNI